MQSATCSRHCMRCWVIVVLGFHNALRVISAEETHVCTVFMIKRIMLLGTTVHWLYVMWDLKDMAEYECVHHIPYTIKLFGSYLVIQYFICETYKIYTVESPRSTTEKPGVTLCVRALCKTTTWTWDPQCWLGYWAVCDSYLFVFNNLFTRCEAKLRVRGHFLPQPQHTVSCIE